MSAINCGIKRWVIDAPAKSQYEECAEGEWCEWDDVSAALMRLDGEHQARVRELADTFDELSSGYLARAQAAEQKLADANALLRWLQRKGGLGLDVHERIEAHLAAQPAAPSRAEAFEAAARKVLADYPAHSAMVARTEAEQAVLDAMGKVPEHELRWHAAPTTPMTYPCRAELARRGLKKEST